MAMSCRSSRKLTVWQRLVTPFFVATCAMDINPFQFVVNTSNSSVVTIPPNKLRDNKWKIPQRVNLPSHMEASLIEAHALVTGRYRDRSRKIEEDTIYFGIELGSMGEFGKYEDLRKCMNFTTNILHQLWHAWPGSEQDDKQEEVVRWMKDNLSTIAHEAEFEKVWKEQVDVCMEKKFLSVKGHSQRHPCYGNWRTKTKASRKRKKPEEAAKPTGARKKKETLPANSSKEVAPEEESSPVTRQAPNEEEVGGERHVKVARKAPSAAVGGEIHLRKSTKDGNTETTTTTKDGNTETTTTTTRRTTTETTATRKVVTRTSSNASGAVTRTSSYASNASGAVQSEGDTGEKEVESSATASHQTPTTNDNGTKDKQDENQTPSAPADEPTNDNSAPTEDNSTSKKRERDDKEVECDLSDDDDEEEEEEEDVGKSSEEYLEDTVEPAQKKFDEITKEMMEEYEAWCLCNKSERLLSAAKKGMSGSVSVADTHHQRFPTEVSYSAPRWLTNDPDNRRKYEEPGEGFSESGEDAIKCLSVFLTACESVDLVPPRWQWDHKLFSEMGTLESSDTDLKNRAMLVCLVLSAATKDELCIAATANLHEKGLLSWDELKKKKKLRKDQGTNQKLRHAQEKG